METNNDYTEESKHHIDMRQSTPSESSDKGAEEILKEAMGHVRYNLNGSVANKQLLWAMQEYASIKEKEAINRTVQECIDIATENGTVRTDLKAELEKLKK